MKIPLLILALAMYAYGAFAADRSTSRCDGRYALISVPSGCEEAENRELVVFTMIQGVISGRVFNYPFQGQYSFTGNLDAVKNRAAVVTERGDSWTLVFGKKGKVTCTYVHTHGTPAGIVKCRRTMQGWRETPLP